MNQTEFHPELDTALRTYLQAAFDWLREPDEMPLSMALRLFEPSSASRNWRVLPARRRR